MTEERPDPSEPGGEPAAQPVPLTADGIPMEANGRALTDIEIQALREARARRDEIDAKADLPPEKGGSAKPGEPTRYGDWERDGRAYDFS